MIGSKSVKEWKIVNIDNEEVSKHFPLITNGQHSYDYYIVSGVIELERSRDYSIVKTK